MQDWNIRRPITGVFPYLRFALDNGVATEILLKGTDLKESDFFDPRNDISLNRELSIVRNLITALPRPETAWDLGRYFYSRAHGVLGGMMETAPTVGDVFACWIEYAVLLHVYFRINLQTVGDKIRLYAENRFNLPDDLFPALLERDIIAGKTAIDHRLPGTFQTYATAISLAHSPRTDRAAYRANFLDDIRFNRPHNYVEIEKKTLSVPLPDADPHKFELFRQQCQAEYSLRNQTRLPLTDTVTLHFQIGRGQASFQDIARKLNMSERTLRDKLAKEGSSYRQIRNRYVFQQSLNLLSNPDLSIETIADTLGYSETCAFSRAFEKITGLSPGRYRKTLIMK
ncbi:AraC family transcriptional regulator [Desulfatiferula olefinivorans]